VSPPRALTAEQARELRQLRAQDPLRWPFGSLAKRYGISPATARRVARQISYQDVADDE
jgi:hypothetical protein